MHFKTFHIRTSSLLIKFYAFPASLLLFISWVFRLNFSCSTFCSLAIKLKSLALHSPMLFRILLLSPSLPLLCFPWNKCHFFCTLIIIIIKNCTLNDFILSAILPFLYAFASYIVRVLYEFVCRGYR